MAGVGLTGAFLDERVVGAQEADDDYVDMGVILDVVTTANVERSVNIVVANYGARTAYDVVVKVDIVYPGNSSHWIAPPNVPVGSMSLENNGYSLRWTIPALGGLEYGSVSVDVNAETPIDKTLDPHEFFGEVSTSSFESDIHKGNNTDRTWLRVVSTSTKGSRSAEGILSTYLIDGVSVDQQHPSPGDIVNFTVTASPNANIDKKVTIKLTDGLTVDENAGATPPRVINVTQLAGTTLPNSAVSYSNGVFTIGTRKYSDEIAKLSMTLPVRVASDAVVNEQCLTATITGNPPPGPLNDHISDNVAKLCLGRREPPYFSSADITEFTSHPCVGNTDSPCDATDDIRVRAVDKTFDPPLPLVAETPLISVPDNAGARKYDDDTNSVNGADIVSWQTPVDISLDEYSSEHERWSNASISISYEMLNRNGDFDKVNFRGVVNALLSNDQRSVTVLSGFGIGASNNGPFELIGEFEKLGTYKVSQTVTATHDNNTPGDTNDDTEYSDTGSYVFHVGPMADLAVADGGVRAAVPADRSALTIVAVNNGLDHSLGAKVTGLPKNAEVIQISQGTYDSSAGVWNIGELKVRGYYRSRGEPEPTLVLAATAQDDPVEVTIASTKNYEVCVGPKSNPQDLAHTTQATCEAVTNTSWNSTPVYDYNSGNNTAKITAAKGTGDAWPDELRFAATPLLTWEAVPDVNHWPVDRYQVQYQNGDNWLDLAEVPGDQTYFADSDARSKPSYRVRALNEAGVPGFWSRPASQVTYRQALPPSPPLNVTAVAGHAGEVLVSWELPVDDGGSPITYYQVQWSRSGTGGWSNACRSEGPSDLSCTQTGIPAGETRYYRVAAHTAQGTGVWSDLAVATTIPGVPSAPRSLSASRAPQDLGGETILAIRLTWSAPATDNGSPIYAYAIEYVDYDQSAGRCGTDWQYLGGDPGVHSNDPPTREFIDTGEYSWIGLEPGAHRCYRVSAINSAGEGPFSNVARASAGGEVPPEWVYLDGEADGQDAITLYWGEPHYDGGAPVTSYQLQYSEDGENWRNLTSTSGSARSYTHTGRKVGETWHYRIRARNSAGWSEWSYPISVTIEEGATANIAQPSLTAQAKTSTEVLLSWNSLCNHNKEGDCEGKGVDGYMVQYSEDGGLYGWESLTWLWTDQTKVVDSTVEPGATRYYRVAGYQEVDRRQLLGRWSQVKSVTTADFVVGAPQNFTVTAEGERGLKLVWDEVTEGRDAASITGYRIERNTPNDAGTDFDTTWVTRQTNRKSNTYVETGLTPNTDYYYRVAAVTRNGSVPYIGPYSDIERFFIPPAGG